LGYFRAILSPKVYQLYQCVSPVSWYSNWLMVGMKQLKTSEKLDVVLGYLKNHPDTELTTGDIAGYAELTNPGIFTPNDLNAILKMLANDHHIEVLTPGLYRVTFEGIVFMEDGGYTMERRERFVKRQYIRYTRKVGNETASLMLWFIGFLIVFGAYFLFKYGYHHWNWNIPF